MSKFVVTIRETTDHEILIEAETSMDARRKAELAWDEFEDGSFAQFLGPRQTFCRRASRKDEEKLK